jgi:rhodanese-related sulfurtransferase
MEQMTAPELKAWLAESATGARPAPVLLDVREPWEFEHCHIEGALLMPMASVPARVEELDHEQPTVVVCHHGVRSFQVGMFLERQGFGAVINLHGGVAAWASQVDPAMPTY